MFRNKKCDIVVPECSGCASLGLACEYGRPAWWYDDHRMQEQKEINKRLIKERKEMLIRKQMLKQPRRASLPEAVGGSSEDSRLVSWRTIPFPVFLPDTHIVVSRSQHPKSQLRLLRPIMCPLQVLKYWSDEKPSFPKRRRSSLGTPWLTMNMKYTTLRHHLKSEFVFLNLILGKK